MLSSKEKDGEGKVSKTDQAKQLLTQYGSAYLITSTSFAIVSFTLCYLAVDSGESHTWGQSSRYSAFISTSRAQRHQEQGPAALSALQRPSSATLCHNDSSSPL